MTTTKSTYEDLSGKRFGKLVAISRYNKAHHGGSYLCECDCGATVRISASNLARGNRRSCGCANKGTKHLEGKRFGTLVVLAIDELESLKHYGQLWYQCRCDCGKTVPIRATALATGQTKSCGCRGKLKYDSKGRLIKKMCSRCGRLLTLDKFGIATDKVQGVVAHCKECRCRDRVAKKDKIRNSKKTSYAKLHSADTEWVAKQSILRCISRGKKKGLKCDTKEELQSYLHEINPLFICGICGKQLKAGNKLGDRLSLDRKNVAKGYVVGNVNYLCMECNGLKNRLTYKHATDIAKYIKGDNRKSSRTTKRA